MNVDRFCLALFVGWIAFCSDLPKTLAAEIDVVSVDVSMPSSDGSSFQLRPTQDFRLQVVCFLGCECPLAKLYAGRLSELADEFDDQEVRFIGINSNPQDTMEEITSFAASHQLRFPILKDHDAVALKAFAATRTPEVIVIDERGAIVYRGRVDDQYRPGVAQPAATRNDLREAIVEHMEGRHVSIARTTAAGCLIAKPRTVDERCDVTYCGQIASVLRKHCVECHREGEIGPFSLARYEDVVGWGDMILEVIEQKRMPPWHATDTHEPLLNARRFPDSDRELVRRWVEGGMPFGDAAALPSEPAYTSGWQFARTPDIVLEVSKAPFRVAAEGVIDYQYFVVDPGFEKDTWVESAEVFPGNRSVLHHAIAFIRPPDGTYLEGLGMLTAYVPGQRIPPVTEGLARRVPKGSKIVFQMHYTPNGSEQFDASRLGLLLADEKEVTHESISMIGINHDLEISPGDANAMVAGESNHLPQRSKLLSISPHMHLRGKAIAVEFKNGTRAKTILEVPHYDFNWQHTYLLQNPITFEEGDALHFKATFDNSKNNPFNPDPTQFVTWGDQTFEEMAIVFYELSKPIVDSDKHQSRDSRNTDQIETPENDRRKEAADQLLNDLDADSDGLIGYFEVEPAVRWRLFRQVDNNGDRQIDRTEVDKYISRNRWRF